MRCPSCGAIIKKRSMKCPECGAFRNRTWVDPEKSPQQSVAAQVNNPKPAEPAIAVTSAVTKPSPSLIEFPGIAKTSKPEWRKELGERVREAQERRARDASLETGETEMPTNGDDLKPTPALELLPQAEIQPLNPIVAAALLRLERANAQQQFAGNTAVARQVAYDAIPQGDRSSANRDLNNSTISERESAANDSPSPPERVHNLAVVRSPAIKQMEISEQRKPKRLIRGENDPALNYLDSIQTPAGFDIRKHPSASVPLRMVSGLIDLLVVCLLASPALALLNLTQLNWQDFRVITFAAAAFVLTGFFYHTVITALTGRTVGMRLCSLRVVDARTGLIPTGAQSAGRALVYMLSVASVGLGFMYTFIDRERRTAHDRFTRTAVVRV
jgi:uncharacterized RDD family membrane protein YckC